MNERSSGRIELAVREAGAASARRKVLLARRNRLLRLIYWTDRMIEELESQNAAEVRRVQKDSIRKLEALAGAVPFEWQIRSTPRTKPMKVLEEVFEIQARLLTLKVGERTAEMRRFDASVDDYYVWAGYEHGTPA